MFQRDYIMRMIEQFSLAVGTLLGLKRERKTDEAQQALGEMFKRLFGLNPQLAGALNERDLIDLLNREGEATAEKMLVLAGLLKEQADLLALQDRAEDSFRLNVKALNLSLMAAREQPTSEWFDIAGQVESLLERLNEYELPDETNGMLWRYYEITGRYADAEDVLFELLDKLERTGGSDGQAAYGRLLGEAEAFYERLLELDDEGLEAGRLPADEVREGLAEIRAASAARAEQPG